MFSIVYDRKAQAYKVSVDGAEAVFPPKGRYEAERFILAQVAPDALRLADETARRHPELAARAHRAAMLVAQGCVQPQGPGRYYVASVNDLPTVYLVDVNTYRCGCEDYYQGLQGEPHGAPTVGGRTFCKHVLAVLFCEGRGLPERHSGASQQNWSAVLYPDSEW